MASDYDGEDAAYVELEQQLQKATSTDTLREELINFLTWLRYSDFNDAVVERYLKETGRV